MLLDVWCTAAGDLFVGLCLLGLLPLCFVYYAYYFLYLHVSVVWTWMLGGLQLCDLPILIVFMWVDIGYTSWIVLLVCLCVLYVLYCSGWTYFVVLVGYVGVFICFCFVGGICYLWLFGIGGLLFCVLTGLCLMVLWIYLIVDLLFLCFGFYYVCLVRWL